MGRSWSCARCDVTASFRADAPQPTAPPGWAEEAGEWLCLGCRREAVMDDAAETGGKDFRARRRRALTMFELLRDPEAADHLIARRVRCSTAMVAPVRAELQSAGRLSSSS